MAISRTRLVKEYLRATFDGMLNYYGLSHLICGSRKSLNQLQVIISTCLQNKMQRVDN
jgi:hypothetical protein